MELWSATAANIESGPREFGVAGDIYNKLWQPLSHHCSARGHTCLPRRAPSLAGPQRSTHRGLQELPYPWLPGIMVSAALPPPHLSSVSQQPHTSQMGCAVHQRVSTGCTLEHVILEGSLLGRLPMAGPSEPFPAPANPFGTQRPGSVGRGEGTVIGLLLL